MLPSCGEMLTSRRHVLCMLLSYDLSLLSYAHMTDPRVALALSCLPCTYVIFRVACALTFSSCACAKAHAVHSDSKWTCWLALHSAAMPEKVLLVPVESERMHILDIYHGVIGM